jgi:hypothetical protein
VTAHAPPVVAGLTQVDAVITHSMDAAILAIEIDAIEIDALRKTYPSGQARRVPRGCRATSSHTRSSRS